MPCGSRLRSVLTCLTWFRLIKSCTEDPNGGSLVDFLDTSAGQGSQVLELGFLSPAEASHVATRRPYRQQSAALLTRLPAISNVGSCRRSVGDQSARAAAAFGDRHRNSNNAFERSGSIPPVQCVQMSFDGDERHAAAVSNVAGVYFLQAGRQL